VNDECFTKKTNPISEMVNGLNFSFIHLRVECNKW